MSLGEISNVGALNARQRVIAVDLDGTLIRSDMLIESIFLFLRFNPLRVFELVLWLFKGKAHFKLKVAGAVSPDVRTLPYNQKLIEWLVAQRTQGAMLVLATASEHRLAREIAGHISMFDDVLGTKELNLLRRKTQHNAASLLLCGRVLGGACLCQFFPRFFPGLDP